jgi:Nucleotidyltransferase of unknown function (DUF6036)
MKRSELEHIIRAAGSIADDSEIVVIGSQAILGQFPDAPTALLASAEADVFPRNHPELSELIDGSIGEGSAFHELYGYYAQGVGEDTVVLPSGWRDRLVRVRNPNTSGITGLCLEVHDLAISKYVAGRDKDQEFTRELAKNRMTDKVTLLARLRETKVPGALRTIIAGRIERSFLGNKTTTARGRRSRK